jgi:hypothetical protein
MSMYQRIDRAIGERSRRVLMASDAARCNLIDPPRKLPLETSGFLELGQDAVHLPGETLMFAKALLLNPLSYMMGRRRCMPDFTAVLSFQAGTERLLAFLAFNCCAICFSDGTERAVGWFFDPVRQEILALVRECFPEFRHKDTRGQRMASADDEDGE